MVTDEYDLDGSIRYLTVEDLIDLNARLIELITPDEMSGVFNRSGLESAQQRPALTRYYEQTNDLLLLGSVLFTALIWNHPFHNANKRTAFAACRLFLLLNGAKFDPPGDELVQVARDLAQRLYDEAQIASWISWYTRPIECTDYLEAIGDAISATEEMYSASDNQDPDSNST